MIYINIFDIASRLRISKIFHADITDSLDITGYSTDHWEMLCLIRGNLSITVGNKLFDLACNSVAFFAPNEFHCIRESKNAQYLFISFDAEGEALTELEDAVVSVSDQEQQLINAICDMLSKDADSPLACQQLYSMLELLLICCCEKEKLTAAKSERDAELFSDAVEILLQSIPLQLSVSKLAYSLGISLSHLKRIFARYARIGVHEYFNILKISRAKDLLKTGESVTRTAELTGFSNQAYFSAAFKRITGISPKEFAADIKAPHLHRLKNQSAQPREKELPSYLL